MKKRSVKLRRQTLETVVKVRLDPDGSGRARVDTGIAFFNHMLGTFAKHGLFDLEVETKPVVAFDEHHIVEDVGIALGQALDSSLGDKKGIKRFGFAIVPMDEVLALVSVDLSGRGYAAVKATFTRTSLGDMGAEMLSHFLETFALNGKFTLHVVLIRGKNDHHKAEAIFKALGIALGTAVQREPRLRGGIISQKGTLR